MGSINDFFILPSPGPGDILNDPTYRKEISRTVEFTVTSELKDDSKPETSLSYGAQSKDEACDVGPEDPTCNLYMWWIEVR